MEKLWQILLGLALIPITLGLFRYTSNILLPDAIIAKLTKEKENLLKEIAINKITKEQLVKKQASKEEIDTITKKVSLLESRAENLSQRIANREREIAPAYGAFKYFIAPRIDIRTFLLYIIGSIILILLAIKLSKEPIALFGLFPAGFLIFLKGVSSYRYLHIEIVRFGLLTLSILLLGYAYYKTKHLAEVNLKNKWQILLSLALLPAILALVDSGGPRIIFNEITQKLQSPTEPKEELNVQKLIQKNERFKKKIANLQQEKEKLIKEGAEQSKIDKTNEKLTELKKVAKDYFTLLEQAIENMWRHKVRHHETTIFYLIMGALLTFLGMYFSREKFAKYGILPAGLILFIVGLLHHTAYFFFFTIS